jgi:hypothetical protein
LDAITEQAKPFNMAFNFNWSPLTADAEFYKRTRDLLTTALNKSPKPPIIVDDILVTEFNLGSVPPELEILEIGDIAEDRFRGIFKMCYSGDAFLTLKTRVQVRLVSFLLRFFFGFVGFSPLGISVFMPLATSEIPYDSETHHRQKLLHPPQHHPAHLCFKLDFINGTSMASAVCPNYHFPRLLRAIISQSESSQLGCSVGHYQPCLLDSGRDSNMESSPRLDWLRFPGSSARLNS